VRRGVVRTFDAGAVGATLAEIDRLAALSLAPALPELGSALKELRNLRATRALARPHGIAVPTPGAGP
jgi:uroporphyrin-3 C-methyltransferase